MVADPAVPVAALPFVAIEFIVGIPGTSVRIARDRVKTLATGNVLSPFCEAVIMQFPAVRKATTPVDETAHTVEVVKYRIGSPDVALAVAVSYPGVTPRVTVPADKVEAGSKGKEITFVLLRRLVVAELNPGPSTPTARINNGYVVPATRDEFAEEIWEIVMEDGDG
jgi:hypothetical protein